MEEITIDDFKKIELRIGKIESAERVEGSDKLIKMIVNIGEEKRQILAGIGKTYEPEYLLEKEIVVVANLAPRSLMGIESKGMLLAATDTEGKLAFLSPEQIVIPGATIR
jgi:methionine--tRNA ligase beta chain